MSVKETRTFKFTCDKCEARLTHASDDGKGDLCVPPGWTRFQSFHPDNPKDMDGSKMLVPGTWSLDHLCPDCSEKKPVNELDTIRIPREMLAYIFERLETAEGGAKYSAHYATQEILAKLRIVRAYCSENYNIGFPERK